MLREKADTYLHKITDLMYAPPQDRGRSSTATATGGHLVMTNPPY
jgi:hypothetical protein